MGECDGDDDDDNEDVVECIIAGNTSDDVKSCACKLSPIDFSSATSFSSECSGTRRRAIVGRIGNGGIIGGIHTSLSMSCCC